MAKTTSANVFIPEVHADMAQAQFLGKVRVAGGPAVLESSELEGGPGDTVQFPKWDALSDLDDLAEGTALVPAAMGSSTSTATIKEAGKAVEISDRARRTGLGDPNAEAARQFGVLAARKVDADLIVAAQADETAQGGGTPLSTTYVASSTGVGVQQEMTWAAAVSGIALFGDEWEPEDFAGFYINSAQHAQLLVDPDFISADKLGQSGTPIARGQIGNLGGVPVFVTDRVTADTFLIVKRNALGLMYSERPIVESERDILWRSTVITTTTTYATKRLSDRAVAVVTLGVGS